MSWFGTSVVPHSQEQHETLAKRTVDRTEESKRRCIVTELEAKAVLKQTKQQTAK